MAIKYYGKNIDLTPGIEEYATKRVERLERLFPEVIEVIVELDEDKSRQSGDKYRAEIHYRVPKKLLYASTNAGSLEEAIDLTIPKIKSQIEKYKGHRRGRRQ